jgi:hypothetical protein
MQFLIGFKCLTLGLYSQPERLTGCDLQDVLPQRVGQYLLMFAARIYHLPFKVMLAFKR